MKARVRNKRRNVINFGHNFMINRRVPLSLRFIPSLGGVILYILLTSSYILSAFVFITGKPINRINQETNQ